MSVRCHDCAKLQKICIFTSPLSNRHTFWTVSQICQFNWVTSDIYSPFSAQLGIVPQPIPYLAHPQPTVWLLEVARWNVKDPLLGCLQNDTKKTRWRFFSLPPQKKPLEKMMHDKKPFTWSVKYFCSWKYNKPLLIFWLQVPELPDLPPISLPISSTTALPTFSFTSPLLSSTISNKPSVTVTSAKEEIKVKVRLQIKSLTY